LHCLHHRFNSSFSSAISLTEVACSTLDKAEQFEARFHDFSMSTTEDAVADGVHTDPMISMADNIHTEDPANYCWLSSTDLRHNISIVFCDGHSNPLFDIDSRPSSDPKFYRHRISLRFSKVDSTIRIREIFSTVHDGKEFSGKFRTREDGAREVATLMIPGTGFVVVRGEQEGRPYPERARFVIQLALKEMGNDKMATFKRVGDTTRLESECGELDLRRHMRRLGEVSGLVVLLENYRGNSSFVGDEIREVLLPRFAVGRGIGEVRDREVRAEDWEMAAFERKAVPIPMSVSGLGLSATENSELPVRDAKKNGRNRRLLTRTEDAAEGRDGAVLSGVRGVATGENGVPVRVRKPWARVGGSVRPKQRKSRHQMGEQAVESGEIVLHKRKAHHQMGTEGVEKGTVEETKSALPKRPKRTPMAMRELAKRLVKGGSMPLRKPQPD
jgi:hypothetical protein